LERDELEELLFGVFNEEISAPTKLVIETTQKMQKAQGFHYALGISIALNILTFIGMILFIALVPKGIEIKIAAFVLVFCFENLLIALVILFKDNVNSALNIISQ
jgi:hypothetical protein